MCGANDKKDNWHNLQISIMAVREQLTNLELHQTIRIIQDGIHFLGGGVKFLLYGVKIRVV